MTDQPAPPSLALLKGVTAGLGVLLVGGIVVLGVLLVRGSPDARAAPDLAAPTLTVTLPLAPGERLETVAPGGAGTAFVIRGPSGDRVLMLGQDGAVTEVRTRTATSD